MMFGKRAARAQGLPLLVLGAGIDALAASTRLARGGFKVKLLAGARVAGGIFAGEEFHPGFHSPGLVHDDSTVPESLIAGLGLAAHGLRRLDETPSTFAPERAGPGRWIHADANRMAFDLHQRDARASRAWRVHSQFLARVRPTVRQLLEEAPADLQPRKKQEKFELLWKGLRLRNLGEADMLELMRVAPMCAADWLREGVLDERSAVAIAHPALIGSWLAPWAAGSAALVLARECMRSSGSVGGPAALARALERAARAAGVEFLCGDAIEEISIDGERVIGVRTTSGQQHEAELVLSTLEVRRTLVELCSNNLHATDLADMLRPWRTRGTTAKLDLALERPLDWGPLPGQDVPSVSRANTCESFDELERAFDGIKYRALPERLALDIDIPTLHAPELAPEGAAVASILVHAVPHELEGGWTPAAREELERRALDALEEVSPRARERIRAVRTSTPKDLEQRHDLPGGQLFGGEPALDQLYLLRPARQLSRHRTPVHGLWIAGDSTHPGPLAPGASGWNAAGALLRAGALGAAT